VPRREIVKREPAANLAAKPVSLQRFAYGVFLGKLPMDGNVPSESDVTRISEPDADR